MDVDVSAEGRGSPKEGADMTGIFSGCLPSMWEYILCIKTLLVTKGIKEIWKDSQDMSQYSPLPLVQGRRSFGADPSNGDLASMDYSIVYIKTSLITVGISR